MRSPDDIRGLLRRKMDSTLPAWLANPEAAAHALPLHPPTAATALAAPDEVARWSSAWQQAPPELQDGLVLEERRWAQLGTQRLPVRWEATGAAALVAGAGGDAPAHWQVLLERVEKAARQLRLPEDPRSAQEHREAVAAAIAGQRSRWLALPPADAELALDATAWFLRHPASGLRIRQVPIAGMHSKWLQAHRALVQRLLAAARDDGSSDLGLAPAPVFHDVLVLDPALRTGLPRSSRLDLALLPELGLSPRAVIICENAETVQVLPDLPGAVALSGAGYSVATLLEVPWIADAPVLYWGDLDADGLRILDRARHHHPRVHAVLMDAATLDRHRTLMVDGGTRSRAETARLTLEESALHLRLSTSGERLEQERIELGYAVAALREALAGLGNGR